MAHDVAIGAVAVSGACHISCVDAKRSFIHFGNHLVAKREALEFPYGEFECERFYKGVRAVQTNGLQILEISGLNRK